MNSVEELLVQLKDLQDRYNAITLKNTLFNFRQQQWGSTLTKVDDLSGGLLNKINLIKQQIMTQMPGYDFSSPSAFFISDSAKNKA